MKFPPLLSLLLFLSTFQARGQSTLLLKPGNLNGKDATICNSPTWNGGDPLSTVNFGNQPYLRNISWTANANGSPEHDWWSLLQFEALDTLQDINLLSATLVLYELPENPWANGGQFGDNQSELFRITEHWEEQAVTWDTRPLYDNTQSIVIPPDNDYHSISIDVTEWVKDMIAEPANNHGFLVRPSNPDPYRSMSFSSSDHDEADLWPELIIQYLPRADTCVFELPNVFTPDGNGINDHFALVTNCPGEVSVQMVIFNRWGEKIFSSPNAIAGWDGRTNGKMAATDIYIYKVVVVRGGEKTVLEGHLSLLR